MAQIPPTSLHLLPSIIPEAVLGTKEPSEKTRVAAFELVVAMGRKMTEGGVVRRDQVDGMDEGEGEEGTSSSRASVALFSITPNSGGEHRGIHDDGSRWTGWCNSPHDQRDRHRYF